MPDYLTPGGLSNLAQYESGGNPLAQNQQSSASGLYGFVTGTWDQFAPSAGVNTNIYPTAASAPVSLQTAVAANTPVTNWTCPGCDPSFANALNSNPQWLTGAPSSGSDTLTAVAGDSITGSNGTASLSMPSSGSIYSAGSPTTSGSTNAPASAAPASGGILSSLFSGWQNPFSASNLSTAATQMAAGIGAATNAVSNQSLANDVGSWALSSNTVFILIGIALAFAAVFLFGFDKLAAAKSKVIP